MIERINQDLCEGCGTCMDICPVDAFRIDSVTMKARIEYPEDCLTCYLCEMACPLQAISVHPFKEVMPPVIIFEQRKQDGTTE